MAAGHLCEHSGVWRWEGDLAVPSELAELLGRRLVGLPEEVSELLDVLVMAGSLDRRAVERLVPLRVVEDDETDGLLKVADEHGRPVVRLAHPLYGEVRLAGLGEPRARRLRGAIVGALAEESDPNPAASLRRAVLSLDSDLPPDSELLSSAAGRLDDPAGEVRMLGIDAGVQHG